MGGELSIVWSPLLPWMGLAGLTLISLVIAGLGLWRRAPGGLLRALFIALLLISLANPSLREEERDKLDDIVIVIVDDSESQEINQRPDQTRAALAALRGELSRLPDTEVKEVRAGAGSSGLTGRGTRIFEALVEALSDVPRERVGGIMVVTDGQAHGLPESWAAIGLDAPLHVLLTGRPGEGDRRLVVEQVPTYGIVGKEQLVTIRVEDLGPEGAALANVWISLNGEAPTSYSVPVGQAQEIPFELDRRGRTVVELWVDEGPAELTLRNNRAAAVVNGVRDRLRILLVSGEPHPGERAWRNILKSDPAVDLVHFTILRPPEKQDGTPIHELSLIAFPTRELFEVKLEEFDLIIFDRYRRRGVLPGLYLGNVARYVEQGGALLEAGGPSFASPLSLYRTPLGEVLPGEPTGVILEDGFQPIVSTLGKRHPVTADLPGDGIELEDAPSWGRWFRIIETRADDAQVVMTGPGERPLLLLDRVGEGRVAQLLSDQMWLWSRGFEGGGPQAELVRRVAHWLMKEPDLEEEDLRAEVNGDLLEITRRSLDDPTGRVDLIGPDGSFTQIELIDSAPGVARATLPVSEGGLYRVEDGERTALAAAGALNAKEFEDPRASEEPLAPFAEASLGSIRWLEEGTPSLRKVGAERDRAGDTWAGVVEQDSYLVTGVRQTPLLPALLGLLLLLGAVAAAWWRESK